MSSEDDDGEVVRLFKLVLNKMEGLDTRVTRLENIHIKMDLDAARNEGRRLERESIRRRELAFMGLLVPFLAGLASFAVDWAAK